MTRRNMLPMLLVCLALSSPHAAALDVDAYNLVWTAPSADAAGAMPIGNGVVGLNVWVERDGDLLFYIARVDAWSECERLLKLGRVRISVAPNPFAAGRPFRQELRLRTGDIYITAGAGADRIEFFVWVSAAAPVIFVECRAYRPLSLAVQLENWRTERRTLTDPVERQSSWTMRDAPPDVVAREVWEAPDVFADEPNAVVWYHRNAHSIVPFTLKHQGLTEIARQFSDPLLNRTFGGRMESAELTPTGPDTLAGANVQQATIRITTDAAQAPTAAAWVEQVNALAAAASNVNEQRSATMRWWEDFWRRSWIFVEGDPAAAAPTSSRPAPAAATSPTPPSRVTQAYILQRWVAACASRGPFPPKFNGSIFTVEPKFTEGRPFNADWRKWGGCYWWQNTRLPYYPMLAAGDFDLMAPLFAYYESAVPGCRARAKLYYNADGVY
ncbi:MAG: DUF5703 domain-containing protein, partial [Planctomycetota bacterium]